MFLFPHLLNSSVVVFCRLFIIFVITSIPIISTIICIIASIAFLNSFFSPILFIKYANAAVASIATINIFIAGYTIASMRCNIQNVGGCV